MKKNIYFLAAQLMLLVFLNTQSYSVNELFRSNASGNWNSNSTWEMSTNGGATWGAAAFPPSNASGEITIRNGHIVTVNVNVTADQLVISTGGQITINSGVSLTIVNSTSQDLKLDNGSFLNGPGNLSTRGNTVDITIVTGASFNAPLSIDSGTTTAGDIASPFIAKFNGIITVNSGCAVTPYGGQTIQANNNLTNNGTISTSTNSSFVMRGASFVHNGLITILNFTFDSTTSISGAGAISPTSSLTIGSSGNVSLASDVVFSPNTFNINSGGVLNPNTRVLTLTSGTMTLNSGATVSNSGTFRTQGTPTILIRQGANFLAPLKVNTGTTTIGDAAAPFTPTVDGIITIDAGASLIPSGGQTLVARNNVINNGTLAPNSNVIFSMKGPSLTNNGAITVGTFRLDSTTTLSGGGGYTSSTMSIGNNGNVTLANDVTFSAASSFIINPGGILNLNGKIFTYDIGFFTLRPSATVSSPGTFRTQNAIRLTIDTGSFFNASLKINTGTTSISQSTSPFIAIFNGAITIDSGATLTSQGGIHTQANNDVLNSGTISPFNSHFRFNGASFVNNNNVTSEIRFLSGSHALSGTGFTNSTLIFLNNSTVTLTSNHKVRDININSGGTFNITGFKLSVTASNPITNNGTLTNTNSTIEYNGTSAQNISFANISYKNLKINNPANTVMLGNFSVSDTLSIVNGDLILFGNIITLSPVGFLSETPGNTLVGFGVGFITTTRVLNAPTSLNVGGLGATITTSQNLDTTEIKRGHIQNVGLNGGVSILRQFDILPKNNSGLNAALVFKYDDSELNNLNEGSLSLFRSTNLGSTWTFRGGTINTSANTLTLSGIDAFSKWSAGRGAVNSQIQVIPQGFYNLGLNKLNMKDTVRIYLRNNFTPFAIVDSAKSVIDSNTFTGTYLFLNTPSGRYYLQTKHRNSIETWSKDTGEVYTVGSGLNYNFTTSASQAFGNNMIQVGTKFCIFSGDVNQDGVVDGTDGLIIDNDAFNFTEGYVASDVNGDRIVDGTDALITGNNSDNFVAKITP